MRLSRKGRDLIRKHESQVGVVYKDPVGHLTAGIGHKLTPAEKKVYRRGQPVPEQQIQGWFTQNIQEAENAILEMVSRPLNRNQFDALVSLVYNIGRGNFAKSQLRRDLNAGNYQAAAKSFGTWRKAGGRVLRGLEIRRKEEAELFMAPESPEPLDEGGAGMIAEGPRVIDIPLEEPSYED